MRIKDITGYEGLYAITDSGQVLSLYRTWRDPHGVLKFAPSRVLKPQVSRKGYHRTMLCRRGEEEAVSVHRLVAAAFCAPFSGETVNHIDGNTLNNNFSNLEWCTGLANLINQHLRKKRVFLTATQIMEVRSLADTVPSGLLAARFNVADTTIYKILHPERRVRRRKQ